MHWLGVADMPKRIPDYPDAFYLFNKIASWGSYVSGFSTLIFFWLVVDAFSSKVKLLNKTYLKPGIAGKRMLYKGFPHKGFPHGGKLFRFRKVSKKVVNEVGLKHNTSSIK